MPKLTLEGSANDGIYPVLPEDTIIGIKVNDIKEKTVNTAKGDSWEKLEFEFEITSVPSGLGPDLEGLVGSRIWGSTSMRFSTHIDNKLRQWSSALLGGLELDEGFELDTDSLLDRRARGVVGNYPKKNGQIGHQVVALLPPVENSAIFAPESAPSLQLKPVASGSTFFDTNQDDEPPF